VKKEDFEKALRKLKWGTKFYDLFVQAVNIKKSPPLFDGD
jgi:hypothetical protein